MAASIALTPAPGLTVESTLSIALSGSGYSTILASTSSQPTFAKNIAYDQFGNPFLSVVQDGKGNVFFDGGFPKYYNTAWSPTYTTFSAMTNQLKLLYNAMKWCAEGNVSANNNILLFGDAVIGESYAVKDASNNGFATCLTNVGTLAGFNITIKDLNDFPASSEMTYEYLSQFSSVIFVSSKVPGWDTAQPRLSAASLANIATYRQQGGGVMIITDHNIFQTMANQVAALFGCSFSGNVDRNPVSVDTLVATYGMHPLWANMTGSVYAGASEGIVTIPVNVPFNPATDRITLTGPGYKTVYLTISDISGEVTTSAYSYAMNVPDPVQGTMPTTTSYKFHDLPFEIIRLNNTDTRGTITVGDTLIGSFSKGLTGLTSKTFTYNFPKPVVAMNKETVQINVGINVPVTYVKNYPLTITPVNITSIVPAKRWATMRNNEMAAVGPKGRLLRALRDNQSLPFTGFSQADSLRAVNNYYSTLYRTPNTRATVISGWAYSESGALENWGCDNRGTGGYGSMDSITPIFGNQRLSYFANYTDRVTGKVSFAVAFTRTDNVTQVAGNFSGRRIQLMDLKGTIVFDEGVSSAIEADPNQVAGLNSFLFRWEIPAALMKTGGAAWSIRVV